MIDDSYDDYIALKRSLLKISEANITLEHISDPVLVDDILKPDIDQVELPNLIILDINMPRMNGIELLEKLKKHELFKPIPTIMFSTANKCEDIMKCRELGSSSYVQKPVGLDKLNDVSKKIYEFFLKTRENNV